MSCILINCIHDIDLTNSRWIHHRTNGRWGEGTELIHNATQIVKLCGLVSFEDVSIPVLHSSLIIIPLTCTILVISIQFQPEWITSWILIRWLRQKPADLDLQCFQKGIRSGSAGMSVCYQMVDAFPH